MSDFVTDWNANVARLAGTYDAADEHDACGVGIVASLDGKARRDVVQAGIDALRAVFHRGAVDADGKTGDGAGIHVEIPQDFFVEAIRRGGHEPRECRIAVGQVFMPKTDLGAQERCREIIETEILAFGYSIYGWRQVPVDVSVIGVKAQATRPEIEQIMIAGPAAEEQSAAEFEKTLYLVRRRIERAVIAAQIQGFYICSLSCRSLVYKGLFLAESLSDFYDTYGARPTFSLAYDDLVTYFRNGGGEAVVRRVVGTAATTGTLSLLDSTSTASVKVDATSPGSWSSSVKVAIAAGAIGTKSDRALRVSTKPPGWVPSWRGKPTSSRASSSASRRRRSPRLRLSARAWSSPTPLSDPPQTWEASAPVTSAVKPSTLPTSRIAPRGRKRMTVQHSAARSRP